MSGRLTPERLAEIEAHAQIHFLGVAQYAVDDVNDLLAELRAVAAARDAELKLSAEWQAEAEAERERTARLTAALEEIRDEGSGWEAHRAKIALAAAGEEQNA